MVKQPKEKQSPKLAHSRMKSKSSVKPQGPITKADFAWVQSILDRTAAELRRLLSRFGPDAQSARSLAARLDLDVALCQRTLAGVAENSKASLRLSLLPGAEGLARFVTVASASVGGRYAGTARAAAEQYSTLIRELGGSQANLIRRIREYEASLDPASSPPASAMLRARRDVLRSVSEVLGYSVGVTSYITVLRPIPDKPELIEGGSVRGFHGVRTRGPRVCITTQATQLRRDASDLAAEVRWVPLGDTMSDTEGFVNEFSTKPCPMVTVASEDGVLRQVIDPGKLTSGTSIDVVLGRRFAGDMNPQYTPDRIWSQILRMRHPASRMVFDAFIHKSMIGHVVPAVGAYYWHPTLPSDPRSNWQDRLPGTPRIEVLQCSPLDAESSALPNHGATATWLFRTLGWHANEFVGFRCDERFPIWGAAYYITFDLKAADPRL